MTRKTKQAFHWIVGILRRNKIPFMISGGLAARAYGSRRLLNDIDIEIPDSAFQKIMPYIRDYLSYGPRRCRDKSFDLFFMRLRYRGQVIDFAGIDSQFLFDRKKKKWVDEIVDLSDITKKKILGLIVPVISKHHLISYKTKIARRVDIEDVNAIEKQNY